MAEAPPPSYFSTVGYNDLHNIQPVSVEVMIEKMESHEDVYGRLAEIDNGELHLESAKLGEDSELILSIPGEIMEMLLTVDHGIKQLDLVGWMYPSKEEIKLLSAKIEQIRWRRSTKYESQPWISPTKGKKSLFLEELQEADEAVDKDETKMSDDGKELTLEGRRSDSHFSYVLQDYLVLGRHNIQTLILRYWDSDSLDKRTVGALAGRIKEIKYYNRDLSMYRIWQVNECTWEYELAIGGLIEQLKAMNDRFDIVNCEKDEETEGWKLYVVAQKYYQGAQ